MFDDPERLKTLRFLVPEARSQFEALLAHAKAEGFIPSIVSAVRTCGEQHNLASSKATRSWHVLGRAVDIELHKGAPKGDPAKFYRELGEWWEQRGGTWGGRWTDIYPKGLPGIANGTPGDLVHFQWTPAPLTAAVPRDLWPPGATCDEVDKIQEEYLRRGGSSAPPAPAPRPGEKKKQAVEAGSGFWLLGRLLAARLQRCTPAEAVQVGDA